MQKDFSYPLTIGELNQQQQHYALTANQEQLKTLAGILQVEAVKSFTADIFLKLNLKLNRLDVWGTVRSELELKSVISLENFLQKYDIPFKIYYDTQATYKDIRDMEPGINDEIPDIIVNGRIDLGDIAIEQLALVLDDYPRRKGEKFEFVSEFDEETTKAVNPFAALEKLKK